MLLQFVPQNANLSRIPCTLYKAFGFFEDAVPELLKNLTNISKLVKEFKGVLPASVSVLLLE